jgi:hypothetical protein
LVPIGASGLMPVIIARLSLHHKTYTHSK